MQFIKAGNEYINLDNVTHFEDSTRYDYAAREGHGDMKPAVHVYFTSGGTGEQSTSLILFDDQRTEFMSKIAGLEIGVSQKSVEQQTADALMRIADAIGNPDDDTVSDGVGDCGTVLHNLDYIARH